MRASGKICVPTLVILKATAARTQKVRPTDDARHANESVRRLHAAGVPMLTGTDSKGPPGAGPAEILHGKSFNVELELPAEARLSPVEVLRVRLLSL